MSRWGLGAGLQALAGAASQVGNVVSEYVAPLAEDVGREADDGWGADTILPEDDDEPKEVRRDRAQPPPRLALEERIRELERDLRERDEAFEESNQKWQNVAKDLQIRLREAQQRSPTPDLQRDRLLLLGKELLGLVGERGSASALMASLRRAHEGGADAEETVRGILAVALEERAVLLNGLSEVIDARPPPTAPRELLECLRRALMSASEARTLRARVAELEAQLARSVGAPQTTPPSRAPEVELEAALAESRRKAQEVEDLRARLRAAEAEKATSQEHQQEMASWREKVALLQQENERLKSAAAAAGEQGRQMQQAQAEVDRLRHEVVEQQHKSEELLRARANAVAEQQAKDGEAAKLREEVSRREKENEQLKAKLSAAAEHAAQEQELVELRAQVTRKAHENDELRQQLVIATQSPVQDQELTWLRNEVERRGRENEEAKARLNAAAELRAQEAERFREEVARKGQENVELQRRVADLEQHQRAQQAQSDGEEVSRLREEVARMGHEAQAFRAQIADLERQAAADASIKKEELTRRAEEVEGLRARLAALEGQREVTASAQQEVKQWYDEANALREEVAMKDREVQALRSHVAALEQQGTADAALKQALCEKDKELEELSQVLTSLQEDKAKLKQAHIQTQQREQVTQGERDQLRAEFGRMTLQLDELRRRASEEGKAAEWARELSGEMEELRHRLQGAEEERAMVTRAQAEFQERERAVVGERDKLRAHVAELGKQMEDMRRAAAEERRLAEKAREKEHEAAQLKVVIDQQRALVRSKQEALERLRQEKEEAEKRLSASEAMVTTLVQEKDRHFHSMRQAEAKGQGLAELQGRLDEVTAELQSRIEEHGKRESQLRKQVSELHTRLQQREHEGHELTAQLAAVRADIGVLSRDYQQSETARENLQKVLEQFQWEKNAEIKMVERAHAKKLEAQEEAFATREEHLKRMYITQIEDAKTEAVAAKESAEVEKLRAKTVADQAKNQAATLRKALDEAISRLQFSESDTVDRKLIANLFVSYFSQRRPRDVLDIIARTLQFTDPERVKVGLRALTTEGQSSGLIGGLFSTVGSMISSPRKEFRPEEAEGKSLGDLWLDYLMTETEADDEPEREAAPEAPPEPVGGGAGPPLLQSRSLSFDTTRSQS